MSHQRRQRRCRRRRRCCRRCSRRRRCCRRCSRRRRCCRRRWIRMVRLVYSDGPITFGSEGKNL